MTKTFCYKCDFCGVHKTTYVIPESWHVFVASYNRDGGYIEEVEKHFCCPQCKRQWFRLYDKGLR